MTAKTIVFAFVAFSYTADVASTQVDILGPAGSVSFGTAVVALPNGNFVVVDPDATVIRASKPSLAFGGQVHLYMRQPDGSFSVASWNGNAVGDHVGSGGIFVLANGNFVIVSPQANSGAGAVTWADGMASNAGAVYFANSIIGSTNTDHIGSGGVTALPNGNYVVLSPDWNNGAGAATWASGAGITAQTVSSANSLVGLIPGDGTDMQIVALANGNYVVVSPSWNANAGAATWGSAVSGVANLISAGNSLVGTHPGDRVGNAGVTALTNGNYVVASPRWANGFIAKVGAATWANGATGRSGAVSPANSFIGTSANDSIGAYVVALSNGNYAIGSPLWANDMKTDAGAVTWGNGSSGSVGAVTPGNSLVGTHDNDLVGLAAITPLPNGDYVVASPWWDNDAVADAGAATRIAGGAPFSGVPSPANSLIGAMNDEVGSGGVVLLSNGNYVVVSDQWNGGAGAVTWIDGAAPLIGGVSAANSLIGSSSDDEIGYCGVFPLTNGNYVVDSCNWHGIGARSGAVTWADGHIGLTGPVTTFNSLVGASASDTIGGGGIVPLSDGNYVVASYDWHLGLAEYAGAVTWGNGRSGTTFVVSTGNSLFGTWAHDFVGSRVEALKNGNYAVFSDQWDSSTAADAGAVSFGRGYGGLAGPITVSNSVIGAANDGGSDMVFAYDASQDELLVGRPRDNRITRFQADSLFANGFE